MNGGEDEDRESADGIVVGATTEPAATLRATPPAGDTIGTSIFDTPVVEPDVVVDTPPPPSGPTLPTSAAKAPPPMVDPVSRPRPAAAAWYRSDEERAKSVYRRANPWYRRLARGVIGLAFLGLAGVGLYAGARALSDWMGRDQLPAAGAEVPEIRSTSFIVTSSAPAPELDGTLTIDTVTSAFEFVGRAGGPQGGLQVVSPDGGTVYVRLGGAPWRAASDTDAVVADVRTAVAYLANDDTADAILTNRLRNGFVELVAEVDEGTGDDRLTRYEMVLDTEQFARDFPLQWQAFQDDAVPGAQEQAAAPVTIWLDTEDVLVRVRDETANWAWERLTYTDQPFRPIDPANQTEASVVQVACVSADGAIFWQTPLASCDQALTAARSAAETAGVGDAFDDLDRTVARICSTLEREVGPVSATADEAALAAVLVQGGVCRGDPAIFAVG